MKDFFDTLDEDLEFEDFMDENMNIDPETGEYNPKFPMEDDDEV
jgi:hypothetical protein